MTNYRIQLKPDKYYHIFNHAVSKDNLFIENKNYDFFINKFEKYMVEYVDVLAYCLMPNHYHFVIKVKKINETKKCQTLNKMSDIYNNNNNNNNKSSISTAFKRLFTSYTNSYNKLYNRRGTLFQPRYKRLLINNETQLKNTIIYVHNNPVIHGFVKKPSDWNYSSYNKIINNYKISWLKNDEVIRLFDNDKNFINCHINILNMDIYQYLI
ncbi:MAG: hypothetical protein Kow0068_10790 [Marinilabiliales bacterium]